LLSTFDDRLRILCRAVPHLKGASTIEVRNFMGQVARAGFARVSSRALALCVIALLVCSAASAQFFPSSPEAAAKVISLTGQVSVLRDSEPWALNIGDTVQAKQVIITGPDGLAKFQVSDGSTFEVYPNSNVVFRKNAPNLRDLLDIFVGRVKVHIQKLGGQPNPNRVYTPAAIISVRGTIFDVVVDDDEETTIVTVEEGAVEVRHALHGGSPKIVRAGESLQVLRSQPLAASLIDKGAIAQRVLGALKDAMYTVMTTSRGGVTTPGGPTLPGNTPPPPPPPAPPPPAPPPPLH